jgi:hypothetical protein
MPNVVVFGRGRGVDVSLSNSLRKKTYPAVATEAVFVLQVLDEEQDLDPRQKSSMALTDDNGRAQQRGRKQHEKSSFSSLIPLPLATSHPPIPAEH